MAYSSVVVSTSRDLFPEVPAKWNGWHCAAGGLAGTSVWSVDTCSLISCTTLSISLAKDLHVQPWDWEGPVAPSKMFRKFVLSHFLMGWGGRVQAPGRWKMWRWLPDTRFFGCWPVKPKRHFPHRQGESEKRREIRWPHSSLLLNASFSFAISYFNSLSSPLPLHLMKR